MSKVRLDVYLSENGHFKSRAAAQAVVMAGEVYVNGQKADKAGVMVTEGDEVEVRSKGLRYVSRGGLKLERAVEAFRLDLSGKVCMDIGASTGGFTDCMLQNGAKRVYAVDVGYGQLAWPLRTDGRVVNMERTNIRNVTGEQIPEAIEFVSADVSFISLKLVLPVAYGLMADGAEGVCLIKPQFEAGRGQVGKKGVVRDVAVHRSVLGNVLTFTREIGFGVKGVAFSPITGPEGNVEYLMYIAKLAGEHGSPLQEVMQ